MISARADQVGVNYDEMEKEYLAKTSLRRMVSADDVAAMVLFGIAGRPQRLRPVAQRLRQRRDALTKIRVGGKWEETPWRSPTRSSSLRRDRRYTPSMSPHLPVTPEEIADAAIRGGGSRGTSFACSAAIPKPASRTRLGSRHSRS